VSATHKNFDSNLITRPTTSVLSRLGRVSLSLGPVWHKRR